MDEKIETLEDGGMAGIDTPDAPADGITGDEISSEADADETNGPTSQSFAPLFITFIFVLTVAVIVWRSSGFIFSQGWQILMMTSSF